MTLIIFTKILILPFLKKRSLTVFCRKFKAHVIRGDASDSSEQKRKLSIPPKEGLVESVSVSLKNLHFEHILNTDLCPVTFCLALHK